MIDDRLSLSISRPDGFVTRWGPDEPDGQDIPNDLTFSDSIPGGHATLTTNLLRRIDIAHSDEQLFADVHCYGPGGRTAWRGRLQQFPRTHGDGYGVSPGAVGWSAHLRDDPSFREIYVDRSAAGWGGASVQRRLGLAGSFPIMSAVSAGEDATTGNPALMLGMERFANTVSVKYTAAGLYYKALPIGEVYYDVITRDLVNNTTLTGGWFAAAVLGVGDTISSPQATSNLAPSASGYLTASGSPTAVELQMYFNSTGTFDGNWQTFWRNMAVYGAHGLTRRGTDPGGFYAADVVADVVSRGAPLLTYTTGAGGSIEPTDYIIRHLAYTEPTTAESVISDVNKHQLYDWGVYDNREFFYRRPDPYRLLWEARLSDGAHLDADGDTGEQVINGVFVTYTDPIGQQKTVGPPGGNFDDTDSLLADTSSTNPVNAAGIPRKWVQLNLSFPATLSDAVQIGYVYLAERSLAGRRGTVTLRGTATHPTEGKVPCWRVRAGDWISLKDLNGATVPRKIINKTYNRRDHSVQLQLDNTVARVDAIMARVGVLAGIATGGGF